MLTQDELQRYMQMPQAERVALDGVTKKRIVETLVGYRLSPVFCEVHDPVITAQNLDAQNQQQAIITECESPDVMSELFFERRRKTAGR